MSPNGRGVGVTKRRDEPARAFPLTRGLRTLEGVTPSFVIALIAWFVIVVGLLFTAARITDRRPRLAFVLLMGALFTMLWGIILVMAA